MKTIIKTFFILMIMIFYACPSAYGQRETVSPSESADPKIYAIRHSTSSYKTPFFTQNIQNDQNTKDFYLQKSKRQKTAAWILLGGGTLLAAVGAVEAEDNFAMFGMGDEKKYNFFFGMAIAGIAADLVSIPFFISSAKNKKKAAALSIHNEKLDFMPIPTATQFPALSLKVSLR